MGKAKQSKQTKVVQPPVSRVTHTVTSTSSQVSSSAAKKGPSHHYVQNSIIGQEQKMKKAEKDDNMKKMKEEKVEMEKHKMMEDKEIILPQPDPMLMGDTREHKPVWTVTRQRPKQKTTAKPENRRKTKSQAGQPKVVKKVCWIGGGRSTLTCKQVRRKLVSGENEKQKQNGRRRIQSMRKTVEKKEKSRMLLHADPLKENGPNEEFSFELANRVDKEEESGLDTEERKAITLKEAFDRTINKLG